MRSSKAWKGCAAGVVGGLAATLVMTGVQTIWNAAAGNNHFKWESLSGRGESSASDQRAAFRQRKSH